MTSPVEAAVMSPVERTAAWVLNNGQYEEEGGRGGPIREEGKKTEKVSRRLTWVGSPKHVTLRG